MRRNLRGPAVVYIVTNLINGNTYIGVTSRDLRKRLAEHFAMALGGRGNGQFYRAIRKYGKAAFGIRVIHECETLGDAKQDEIRLIAELKPQYNSTKGGDGQLGRPFTEEAKKRIGAAHIGTAHHAMPHSEETRRRLREIGLLPKARAIWAQYAHLGPAASSKRVLCLDDGIVYPSAAAASRAYGVAKSALIELCLGQRGRKTVGGKRFQYEAR